MNYLLKGRALANLVMDAGPVQGIEFSGASPVLQVSIIVQNTNSLGFTINSMAGNVYTSDGGQQTLIGNVFNFAPFTVPPNSQSTFILNLKLFPVGVVNTVIQAIQYKNFTKQLSVDMTVNIDGLQFTKTLTLTVGV